MTFHLTTLAKHVLAIALAAGLLAMPQASQAQVQPAHRTVTVSATGTIEAIPDIAQISTGVLTEAPTARAAMAANSKVMQGMIEGLKALGIAAKDIQTAQISLQPQHDQSRNGRPPVVVGYRAVNTVEIVVRDLQRLGEVLDRSIELGANQLGGIRFQVAGAENLLDEARKMAMANAERRARLYAAAAKAELGSVLTISETAAQQPRPMVLGRAAMAQSVPVEPGSETLTAEVHVTWELR